MPFVPDINAKLVGPTTSDGKNIVTQAVFPGDQNIYFCGRGDDVAGGVRGKGTPLRFHETGPTVAPHHQTTWQFIDNVYMIGGSFDVLKGGEGDIVHFDLVAGKTDVVANGTTEGNCNLVSGVVIVPTVGGGATGTHDVDVDAALNANLADKSDGSAPNKVTQAVPVPAVGPADDEGNDTPAGFWNWDDDTGVITPAIGAGGEPEGYWNLYTIDIVLTHWVEGLQLWDLTDDGSGARANHEFMLPTKAKKVIPHWQCRVTLEMVSTHDVRGSWVIYLGRTNTT